jgi:hypothetical protein
MFAAAAPGPVTPISTIIMAGMGLVFLGYGLKFAWHAYTAWQIKTGRRPTLSLTLESPAYVVDEHFYGTNWFTPATLACALLIASIVLITLAI